MRKIERRLSINLPTDPGRRQRHLNKSWRRPALAVRCGDAQFDVQPRVLAKNCFRNLTHPLMNKSCVSTPTASENVSRRQFLKNSSLAAAGAAALSQVPFVLTAHAAPDDPIRIGLIGCGGRGTGAVADALGAATDVNYPQAGYHTENVKANADTPSNNVQVLALADGFADRRHNRPQQL